MNGTASVIRDIIFVDHVDYRLHADIIYPANASKKSAPKKVICWWSGGGWTHMGRRGAHDLASWMTQSDRAIVALEYRVAQPGCADGRHFSNSINRCSARNSMGPPTGGTVPS